MILWRKNYPRCKYQPIVAINGVYYEVKDEVIFKRHECEWVLPDVVARKLRYNPRHLPVLVEGQTTHTGTVL